MRVDIGFFNRKEEKVQQQSFVNSFANPRIKHSISKERNKITVKIGLSPQIHTPCCGYGLALLNPKVDSCGLLRVTIFLI